MSEAKEYVGIDVSKTRLDVVTRSTKEFRSFSSSSKGMADAVAWLKGLGPALVVMEATGGLEVPIQVALQAAGLPVAVVNPRQVRDFAKATGRLAKTDKIDAEVLAHYAGAIQPEPRRLPEQEARDLHAVATRRQQIVDMIAEERNRLGSAPTEEVRRRISDHLEWLKRELTDINKDLERRIKANPVWSEKVKIMDSAPGVGPVLSITLLVGLPELGTIDRKHVSALAGVAPFNCDSGKHRGERHIRGGRRQIRGPLYMAAVAAARWNPTIRPFYERLLAAGKERKVALTACMRKLLTILNAMLKHNAHWRWPTAQACPSGQCP